MAEAMANTEHVSLVKRGVEALNKGRGGYPLQKLDLRNANFEEADLKRADLRKADLAGANLTGANLAEARIGAANLAETNLAGANLTEVNFFTTSLTKANLIRARLAGANLRDTRLTKANLTEVDLTGAKLTGADLTGADLTGANLTGADFAGADLTGANLTGANLTGANFAGANLTGANFNNIDFKKSDFSNAILGQNARINPDGKGPFKDRYLFHCAVEKSTRDYTKAPSYLYADIDEQVIINRITTLEVTISGKEVDFEVGPTAQTAKTNIDSSHSLTIEAISKFNFKAIGESKVKTIPPEETEVFKFYFDFRATALGESEIWVIFYQKQIPLSVLSLKPFIVKSRAQIKNKSKVQTLSLTALSEANFDNPKIRSQSTVTEYPSGKSPLHQLRIIEQSNGERTTYRYDFESPTLGILKSFESKPIVSNRQEFVKNLYSEIESRWVSSSEDSECFLEELRAFGGSLIDELFPSELKAILWEQHNKIENIMVLSTEPFIPWELIHLKEPGKTHLPNETKFLGQMGLVRWSYGSGRFPPQIILGGDGFSVHVVPDYPDTRYKLPQAEQEAQFLSEALKRSFPVSSKSSVVRKVLQSDSISLFHFAGHGIAEQDDITSSKLMLEGKVEKGRYIPDYLSAVTVAQTARLGAKRPIVVLNSCQVGRKGYSLTGVGGFAEAFLKAGAGAFIGPLWSVKDKAARVFIESLYKELLKGKTLSNSANMARKIARENEASTWLSYAVYGHPDLVLHDF